MTEKRQIDKVLLTILKRDGRASVKDLARRIGVSDRTITRHIKAMEANRRIDYFTYVEGPEWNGDIPADRLGAFLLIRCEAADTNIVADRLRGRVPYAIACYIVAGDDDIVVTVATRNLDEVNKARAAAELVEGVKQVRSQMVFEQRW